jgi:aspartate kinase
MILMKFGGTSVEDANAIERVASIVRERLCQKPVVIVSAMARVTDKLLAMGHAAANGDLDSSKAMCAELRRRHCLTASALVPHQHAESLLGEVESAFDRIDDLLQGISAVGELSLRTADCLLSFGEQLSSKIVNAAFRARGIASVLVDSRQNVVTDAAHGQATPLFDETKHRLLEHVAPLLEQGQAPVMGGFIAATVDGVPTTLGRGGSDFSASIVGAALGAKRIEIWTYVEGMMTSDPAICPDARPIRNISFEEAAEMAHFGAKVLHPATLIPAIQKNIPVYVLNSRDPESRGTCVKARAARCATPFRAIAAKRGVTIINVVAARMLMAHGFLRGVFEACDRHRCPVDLVSTSEVSVSLTVESGFNVQPLVDDLRKLAEVTCENHKAIICLVGREIQGRPGIAAQVFAAVAEGQINVRMISQGASEINISFVIDEADVNHAVQRLHAHFFPAQQRERRSRKAVCAQPAGDLWIGESCGVQRLALPHELSSRM